jgi:hypothetical protein
VSHRGFHSAQNSNDDSQPLLRPHRRPWHRHGRADFRRSSQGNLTGLENHHDYDIAGYDTRSEEVSRTVWRPARDEHLSKDHNPCARNSLPRAGGSRLPEPEGARQYAPLDRADQRGGNILQDVFAAADIGRAVPNLDDDTEELLRSEDAYQLSLYVLATTDDEAHQKRGGFMFALDQAIDRVTVLGY